MNLNDATLPLKSWQQRPDARAVGTGPRCQADNQFRTGTRTKTKGSSLLGTSTVNLQSPFNGNKK